MDTSVIDRVKKTISHFKMAPTAFAAKAGIASSNFSKMLLGEQKVTGKTLNKIATAFDVNYDWLASGEGAMLPGVALVESVPSESDYRMIPVVHIDSVGGVHSQNDILSSEYIERYIPMEDARPGDIAIYQSGSSMEPAIPSGALLLIREVVGWQEYIGYGDVFVMLLKDERRITKEIRRYEEDPKNYYWCVSYNPNVADEELPKSFVSRVWKVIKVLINKGW